LAAARRLLQHLQIAISSHCASFTTRSVCWGQIRLHFQAATIDHFLSKFNKQPRTDLSQGSTLIIKAKLFFTAMTSKDVALSFPTTAASELLALAGLPEVVADNFYLSNVREAPEEGRKESAGDVGSMAPSTTRTTNMKNGTEATPLELGSLLRGGDGGRQLVEELAHSSAEGFAGTRVSDLVPLHEAAVAIMFTQLFFHCFFDLVVARVDARSKIFRIVQSVWPGIPLKEEVDVHRDSGSAVVCSLDPRSRLLLLGHPE
jgi:hypothetical protein